MSQNSVLEKDDKQSDSNESIYATQLPSWARLAAFGAAAAVGLVVTLWGYFGGFLDTKDVESATMQVMSDSVAITTSFVAITAVIYAIIIGIASFKVEGPRFAVDRIVTAIVAAFFAAALIPLLSVTVTVISAGVQRFDANFFSNSMYRVSELDAGGAIHAVYGSLIITGLTTLISVPIGLFAAIYLVEYADPKSTLARALTFFVDVMTGIPSIVAGLFAAALVTTVLDDPGYKAGIVGAIALSVLMIPIVVRSSEEMLRLVPRELREASYALGVTRAWTILKVVLPTAIAGIVTGITLAIARVMGETAPLLITVGVAEKINLNPFDGRMETLPIFSYYNYATPTLDRGGSFDLAWASALLLIIIVMALNILARLISKYFAPKGSN